MTEAVIPHAVLLWLATKPDKPVELRTMRLCCVDTKWVVELSERGEGTETSRSAVAIDAKFASACEGAMKRLEYA